MPRTYFEIDVAFHETDTGKAVLVTPDALDNLDWTFVLVDECRGTALVAVEASRAEAAELAAGEAPRKLTKAQLTRTAGSYRTPRLKREYEESDVELEDEDADELPEPELVVRQTVRSGYRLVDVTVDPEPVGDVVPLPPGPATRG